MEYRKSLCSSFVLGAAVSIGLFPQSVCAQSEADAGQWVAIFSQGDLDSGDSCLPIKWWFDGHARFFDNADGFGQSIIRPGVGWALNDSAVIWAGYGWIHTDPPGRSTVDEHRLWQQITWGHDLGSGRLGLRSRLEQRFVNAGSETGWRFRQLASFRQPLPSKRFSFVVWDELFLGLNDTNWNAEAGFDQNRVFVGIGVKRDPCKSDRVEIGYLNQYIRRGGRDDLSNHLISVNLYCNP